MTTLFDEKALRKRLSVVYAQMAQRAKPKLFKSGKRKGQVRVPGIFGLPFTREQFWSHALKQVGPGVTRCEYCVEIGRPANLITLANCVFDHHVPIARGGTWDLSNLRAVCADCNGIKGKFTYEAFVGVMAAFERWEDKLDRSYLHACLRTHGVAQRLRGFHGKPKSEVAPAQELVTSGMLALQEDF